MGVRWPFLGVAALGWCAVGLTLFAVSTPAHVPAVGEASLPRDGWIPLPIATKSDHRWEQATAVGFPSDAAFTFECPMEASSKPQLPLDDLSEGVVRALDDRLVIERLTVADERAARVVRMRAEAGQRPAETVAKAVEIGARVLDSEETAANVDYVRAEFERHAGALRERLMKQLEAGDEALSERIAEAFDGTRDGSVQKDIETLVETSLEGQREAILKLLRVEDGANPLFDYKQTMVEVFKGLRETQQREAEENRKVISELRRELVEMKERALAGERVREAEEAGTRKGRSFEETVHAEIERIAEAQGDAARHVGDESSEAGGKKGDTVVEVGAGLGTALATIVFEAKNKRLSKNDAWSELNACMRERDAAYSVLVVAGDDKIPAGLEDLTEYQGNKIIAVLDRDDPDPLALRLVYRYVRARVLAATDTTLQVDASGIRDASEEAQAALKRANRVRKSLTGITSGAEAARTELNSLIEDAEACLTRIDALVAAAAQDAHGDSAA